MNKNIIFLDKKTTVKEAMSVFASNDVDLLLVESTNANGIEIITKNDLMNALLNGFSLDSTVDGHQRIDVEKVHEKVNIGDIDIHKTDYFVCINDESKPVGSIKSKELAHTIAMQRLSFQLESIIESSYDGIYITDGNARTIKINKAYERITGLNRYDMIGKYMQDLVDDGVLSESVTLLVLKRRKVTTISQEFKTGKKALVTGNPIFDNKNQIIMVVTNVRDVTELADLRTELNKNRELTMKYYSTIEELKLQMVKSEHMVVEDESNMRVLDLAHRIARVDTTVLILGETGVGKEEIAKLIHRNSLRKDNPFVKINCGAIPANLIESELFGYEKGAFTGASNEGKIGLFEVAEGGTLLLDEIGELPFDMQVKLLRVLQEQEIKRVGGTKSIKVDVRILAATNKDLEKMVHDGSFRGDLYYRLNVVPITILPLRERKKDILPLAFLFIDQFNKKYKMNKSLTYSANSCLLNYEWPGNVRELKNIIERVVVTAKSDEITDDDMPDKIQCKTSSKTMMEPDQIVPLKEALNHVEERLINRAFNEYGNVRDAAKALGIDASTFVRKRQKYVE
jgi:PAS domain S-box-containing protein